MKDSKQYSSKFFDRIRDMSSKSATAAVPEILKIYPAQSVIDVGCGAGAWVKAFEDCGVKRPVGIDGDYEAEYAGTRRLHGALSQSDDLDVRYRPSRALSRESMATEERLHGPEDSQLL
jgi:2-polyprenyl-3-methyl-5-hydroxy-6-metoxy-1,4-benzoquinol methylase